MTEKFDAIIIGGGHNGLVTAAYLGKSGRRVLVLERREVLGGASVTEEVYPGFKYTVFSYVVSLLRPEVIRELRLARHGLVILPLESTLSPLPDGDCLYRDGDHYASLRDIARFSQRDADAYEDYSHTMYFMAKAVKPVLDIVPPDPSSLNPFELGRLLRFGRQYLKLEAEQLHTLVRLMTMSSADFVERWFESEPLKGSLSASGIIGTFLGPRSPGTAYVLLHHYMGEIDGAFRSWGLPRAAQVEFPNPSPAPPAVTVLNPHGHPGQPGAGQGRKDHAAWCSKTGMKFMPGWLFPALIRARPS